LIESIEKRGDYLKRPIVLLLAIVLLLSVAGCGEGSIPSEVSDYAKKHELEVLSAEKLEANAIVGKRYVVYGTVSYISFKNYEKGSADLKELLSRYEGLAKDIAESEFKGKMSYYLRCSGGPSMDYDDWNFASKMLKINKGDEVAFIVTCEDGYTPGSYKYVINEKIWENRHSETTIEADHDAPKDGSSGS